MAHKLCNLLLLYTLRYPFIFVIFSSPSAINMELLLEAIDAGLQIEVNKVFAFAKTQEAYQYAERGGYVGKVAVEID